ncbi:MAG: FAD-binding oxidoreductase [Nitrospinae bacterium]|nr:FAD-binding oxidoreductase [Nitrospinota bacterium]
MTRRSALRAMAAGVAAAGVAGCGGAFAFKKKEIPGSIAGAGRGAGHLLNGFAFPEPAETMEVGVAIVGCGVAGVSAAWALSRNGFDDYAALELEQAPGGNAGFGRNAVTAYPRGAYYVPVPNMESKLVRTLFEEAGIIEGYDNGLPVFNEYHLCSDPQERLFIHGRWQEGLFPQIGTNEADSRQYREFFAAMDILKNAKGNDGRPAFAIPMELSSRDPKYTALDKITMAEYMRRNGWDSKYLLWYVNYCMRDDYGSGLEEVSAWAGAHYFASRRGKGANADSHDVLTWPEGNGFLTGHMIKKARPRITSGALVYNIEREGERIAVDHYDPASGKSRRFLARAVIYAAPRFTAGKVIKQLRQNPPEYLPGFTYAPWLVANVSLKSAPAGNGAPLAWDNVSFHNTSLGYVVATHQSLRAREGKTVITFYDALSAGRPADMRRSAMGKTYGDWAGHVVKELSLMHKGVEREIENIEVWLWGHGMIRPVPGFIWGETRREALKPVGGIFFAHSDMSGISIFEEAQYRGVKGAQDAMRSIGKPFAEMAA